MADPKFNHSQDVDLLFGSDVYYNLITPHLISLGPERPVLQNTQLGWVLGENVSDRFVSSFSISSVDNEDVSGVNKDHSSLFLRTSKVDEFLKKFWDIEGISKEKVVNNEDELAEQIFQDTTVLLSCGRFQVNMPFKNLLEHKKLGESFSCAKRQFLSLETKLHKNPEIFSMYKDFINEYVRLQQIRDYNKDLNGCLHPRI